MNLIEAIDQGAVHPFRYVGEIEALHPVLIGLSWLGHPLFLLGVLVLAGAVFLLRKEGRAALVLALALGSAVGLGYLGNTMIPRKRPNVSWSALPTPEMSSFPSIQALGAAALYGALGVLVARRRGRPWPVLAGAFLALLAGAAQLLIGHNFLTDVFAGWIGGGALASLLLQLEPPPATGQPGAVP